MGFPDAYREARSPSIAQRSERNREGRRRGGNPRIDSKISSGLPLLPLLPSLSSLQLVRGQASKARRRRATAAGSPRTVRSVPLSSYVSETTRALSYTSP